jgi:hypothetical protein
MKINQTQIDQLYLFTRQHFVEWYDLQTELVDHLANAIEAQWQVAPTRTFDDALQIEFKKFGIFGFTDVVQERHVALEKKYRKIVWSHFKTFFRLPQIILTFSAVVALFFILKWSFYSEIIVIGMLTLLLVFFFVELRRNARRMKRINQATGKKWLFKEILNGYGQGSGIMFLPLQMVFHLRNLISDDFVLGLISFFIISLALVQYIVLVIIPKKAENYLKEVYPEYEFVD